MNESAMQLRKARITAAARAFATAYTSTAASEIVKVMRVGTALMVTSALLLAAVPCAAQRVTEPVPLVIGETFTIESKVLGETRRINVYRPPVEQDTAAMPVLYMPDGGIAEDFVHVAGIIQISVLNGTMRPFMLVGIENTERRRDLTGPTTVAADSAIAPRVGGSSAFRRFIRTELKPAVSARYRTTAESGIVGESLAGLFIVESFLREPDLFDTYIAFDPSLWWDGGSLVNAAPRALSTARHGGKKLYLASSNEPELVRLTSRLADILTTADVARLEWQYQPMPAESHGTIYHPAALAAFRSVLNPPASQSEK